MAMLTQGTQVYVLDDQVEPPVILTVDCATAFNPGGNPADQIEATCLEDFEREYLPGLRTPGQASLTINADPRNASHLRLHALSNANPPAVLQWYVGWSDGTDAPTIDVGTGDVDIPDTRTWFTFEGYVSDFPFDFSANTVVTSEVQIQRSGGSAWIAKDDD